MTDPIFLSKPDLDIGMPVSFAILCFSCVMPIALFQEKDNPGILISDLFAIYYITHDAV